MWIRFFPERPSVDASLEPLRATLPGQASAAQADAAELMRQAAALEAQSAAEQQAGALQEDLRRRQQAAVASLEVKPSPRQLPVRSAVDPGSPPPRKLQAGRSVLGTTQNLKVRDPGYRMFTPFWRRHGLRPGTRSPDTQR